LSLSLYSVSAPPIGSFFVVDILLLLIVPKSSHDNNNYPIYKAALASEALAAGQSWVLLKSLTVEIKSTPTTTVNARRSEKRS